MKVTIVVGDLAVLVGTVDMSGVKDASAADTLSFVMREDADVMSIVDEETVPTAAAAAVVPNRMMDLQAIPFIQISLSLMLAGNSSDLRNTVPLCAPFSLSTKRFLEVKDKKFRLDFDVFPKFIDSSSVSKKELTEGDNVSADDGSIDTDERQRIHLSIGGLSSDLDSVARKKWSESRTPHFAIINRLPEYVRHITKPNRNPSKRRQAPSHSLMTPWFPSAANPAKIPGMVRLGEQRPLSPTWHPAALGFRDPFPSVGSGTTPRR